MRTLLRKIKDRKFAKVFGFVPNEGGRIRSTEQQAVDSVLEELAERFDSLCKEQELRHVSFEKDEDLYALRVEALALYLNLQAAKTAFWRVHGLARVAGFSVEERYSDYIPSRYA